MIDAAGGGKTHDPTVLAVSRYGTFWLLDARTGAVRWQVVNGSRPTAIDHGGEMIYATYTSETIRRDTRKRPAWGENLRALSPEERRQYHDLLVTQAELLALRARDGAPTWRLEGWMRQNQPLLVVHGGRQLDGDLVITDVTDFAEATPVVSALDARTGALRWRHELADAPEIRHTSDLTRLQGACAGRVYISWPAQSRLDVHDSVSGELMWSHEQRESEWHLSQGGALLAELGRVDWNSGKDRPLTVRRTSDGQVIATLSLSPSSTLLGLTDAGIVYLATGPNWHRWVDALDTRSGELLWHTERHVPLLSTNMDISIFTDDTFGTRNRLYFSRLNQSSGLAEALAFDAQSGREQWYWHGPSHLLALLKLWGWRTPQVIAFALSQFRRSLSSAHGKKSQKSIWTRIQSLWDTVRWNILRGQWLRPASLLSSVFAAAVYPDESQEGDLLYIGTSMGLSALRGSDGHPLWHELLMMEISRVITEERRLSDSSRQERQSSETVSAASAEG
ncbi:MAG: PQQ-binding-like beta-propeller repeat protein [Ktedonobacterales bacterium]